MLKPALTKIDKVEHPLWTFVLDQTRFRAKRKSEDEYQVFQYNEPRTKIFSFQVDEIKTQEIKIHPTQWVIIDDLNNVYILWPNEFEGHFAIVTQQSSPIDYGGEDD